MSLQHKDSRPASIQQAGRKWDFRLRGATLEDQAQFTGPPRAGKAARQKALAAAPGDPFNLFANHLLDQIWQVFIHPVFQHGTEHIAHETFQCS